MARGESRIPIEIPADSVTLEGEINLPKEAKGVVIFAHGSGSSRLSPRNVFVARVLQSAGLGTLLFDLLTKEEDLIYENRFDIPLLGRRLKAATIWVKDQVRTSSPQVGYFGASTGAAAAIMAAAELGEEVKAIVSRGGRPDLAKKALGQVLAPTLFIVGGNDRFVLKLNRDAMLHMKNITELKVIPGASHLFEEPGTLEEVARLAAEWFTKYLNIDLARR
ncbi:MAG TPA: dienelactone hydrolase family protein [Thermodesulfobacteriota bacterium]|nr:dienelactone hydrolase family protein [Thermodesulfobacteriota bacterium]